MRLVLGDNEHDLSLDVTCRNTVRPYEDPAEVTRVDGRLISERITYEASNKDCRPDCELFSRNRASKSFW